MSVKEIQYSREELIHICEQAIIDVKKWNDIYTPSSQISVGTVWALLKANCPFEVLYEKTPQGLCTDKHTIWIRIWHPEFIHFDITGFDLEDKDTLGSEIYYLPTIQRLEETGFGENDWY